MTSILRFTLSLLALCAFACGAEKLTNATLSGTITLPGGVSFSAVTGTGNVVLSSGPTLLSPIITGTLNLGSVTLTLPADVTRLGSSIDLASEVNGTLPISSGGTGQVTAAAALSVLLPSQSGHNGHVLQSDGMSVSWQAPSGGGGGGGEIDARIVYVRNDGNDTTGDGSQANPVASVAKALDIGNALPSDTLNGFIVDLGPGPFILSLTSPLPSKCLGLRGVGRQLGPLGTSATALTIYANGTAGDEFINDGGNGVALGAIWASHMYLEIYASGGNGYYTVEGAFNGGNGGGITVYGNGSTTVVAVANGGEGADGSGAGSGNGGNGGYITLYDCYIGQAVSSRSVFVSGGSSAGAGSSGGPGAIFLSGCDLSFGGIIIDGTAEVTAGSCRIPAGMFIANDKGGNSSW